jgi:uncharacterized membrane protein YciS (DUF1049 family)
MTHKHIFEHPLNVIFKKDIAMMVFGVVFMRHWFSCQVLGRQVKRDERQRQAWGRLVER